MGEGGPCAGVGGGADVAGEGGAVGGGLDGVFGFCRESELVDDVLVGASKGWGKGKYHLAR